MTQSPAADIRLGNLPHFYCCLHPCYHVDALQCVLQGQTIHHGGQHTHIVGGYTVHSLGGTGCAAPDVAAAHHQGGFHAKLTNCLNLLGDIVNGCRVNAKALFASQCFAADFQYYTFILQGSI